MKFICLICAETVMEQMTEAEKHFQEYAEFTAHHVHSSVPFETETGKASWT
jgi:hypothetical protein